MIGSKVVRYSVRDILWLTLLVAVCTAWWIDKRDEQRKAQSQTYIYMDNAELSACVAAIGGWEKVHCVEFVYSRWYGTEWKILPVDGKMQHYRMTPENKLQNYDDPASNKPWPMATMMPRR